MNKAAPKKKAVVKKKPATVNSMQISRIRNVLFSAGFKTIPQIRKGIRVGDIRPVSRAVTGHIPGYGKAAHKRLCEHLKIENNQSRKNQATGDRSGNGGARKGSGRKKGAATKKTREIADKLAEDGEQTPLEYMLETMRETPDKLRKMHKDGEIDSAEFALRIQELTRRRDNAAEKAAPYIHPRLASIEAKVEDATQERWLALLEAAGL